ncbi:MAG: geranylgeranylglyceryl/heptaprenylglyceryl phosphate synthase [Bacteroidetes bacterium]|nr:geranylgeranylglyceryl/heptaprenylglyceryl phosphate synthase [Bacteroidota bacterium]HMU77086.1 geranylgeranylglyceryl/heptaprenylglyceryl phosphate synthase [Bacteroidia bacterium]HCI57578.1 geranylgeranylglyceryl/heptaprenylglyceryl phosphate synthase [Bacteroidota bacterium]HMX97303.1 geranylgeranylglyceryl/heptaprenylglyceryl phosphate synthase [Bacteroidia bacterium]HNB11533.1 geranylgeranylglyceryl/heptaprenylglyceryl phosphate synthase [Bacteroidia bacterium]
MKQKILQQFQNHKKQLAVLIDPDKVNEKQLKVLCTYATAHQVDYFFVGGSILTHGSIPETIAILKKFASLPVILFPGNASQVDPQADAILYLSLISGRNADLLIGQHVLSAMSVKLSGLEAIPTGYILIDSGNVTTVQYVSNTKPIPHDHNELAVSTAVAGQLLGMQVIYLEAGSGARRTVSGQMIEKVKKNTGLPLIVGGGIRTAEKAIEIYNSGADIIVVGNAIEDNPELMLEIAKAKSSINQTLNAL